MSAHALDALAGVKLHATRSGSDETSGGKVDSDPRPRARARFIRLAGVAVLALAACAPRMPAGVWTSYEPGLIVDKFSDQGPWGGTRWIHWTSEVSGTFIEADVRAWAEEHGWKFIRRSEYSAGEVDTWHMPLGRAGFPLPLAGAPFHGTTPGMIADLRDRFPRHIRGEVTVLEFESGWIRVAPGSGSSETAVGYVLLGEAGRKLAIYHAWGEI